MTVGRKRLSRPKPCKAVQGKDYVGPDGLVKLENHEWLSWLTEWAVDPKSKLRKRVGLDPRDIPPDILTAAGHPPRSASNCIKTYLKLDLEKDYDKDTDRGLQRLRELCMECAGGFNGVRDCAIISCPLWNHRLGCNPHNYHKNQAKPKRK